MVSLSTALAYHARLTPQRPALVYRHVSLTYADLQQRIVKVARYLDGLGVGKGDVVALLMKNSTAWVTLALAVGRVGAVLLPLNYRLSATEVDYILANAGARQLFVDEELSDLAPPAIPTTTIDSAVQVDPAAACWAVMGESVSTRVAPGDLFRLMYTSGTTDRPKGVMHTYENFYWKSWDHIVALELAATDRLLVVGPLYHVGACDLPGLAVLLVGGTLYLHREFEAHAVLRSLASDRITGVWLAPVMLTRLLAEASMHHARPTSLRWVIGGGERTPEERILRFQEVFAKARYIDAYGLTESCSGDTFMEPGCEIAKIGSTGRPVAHLEISIRDDQGQVLAAEHHGEICLRGPKVTPGYWRDPEKTAASFFADGWFRTGDVGYLDPQGFLYLTDRVKDMIISGGENIASSEVERVLYQLDAITEAAVVGIADPQWGEKVVAVVVFAEGRVLSDDEIIVHCRSQLASFKVPKMIQVRDALPRNPSGKVLKRVLRNELEQPTAE